VDQHRGQRLQRDGVAQHAGVQRANAEVGDETDRRLARALVVAAHQHVTVDIMIRVREVHVAHMM
jgi:hypothetical protein